MKKQQGFAVTGKKDAIKKGSIGGKKGGAVKTKKGFAVKNDPREMAKRSHEARRRNRLAAEAAKAI